MGLHHWTTLLLLMTSLGFGPWDSGCFYRILQSLPARVPCGHWAYVFQQEITEFVLDTSQYKCTGQCQAEDGEGSGGIEWGVFFLIFNLDTVSLISLDLKLPRETVRERYRRKMRRKKQ